MNNHSLSRPILIAFSLCLLCAGAALAQQEEAKSPVAIQLRLQQAIENPPDFVKGDPRPLHWTNKGGMDIYYSNYISALLGKPYAVALQRGRWQARQGNFAEACSEFAKASDLQPRSFPYEEWCDALEASGNIEKAQAIYRKITTPTVSNGKPDPVSNATRGDIWIQYALFLVRQKNYAEALKAYENGRRRVFWDEEMGEPFRLDMTAKTFDIKLFEAAAHTISGVSFCYARSMSDHGCPEDVRIREYKKALALKPNYLPAILYLAQAYQYHYDPDCRAMVSDLLARAALSRFPGIKNRAHQLQKQLSQEQAHGAK